MGKQPLVYDAKVSWNGARGYYGQWTLTYLHNGEEVSEASIVEKGFHSVSYSAATARVLVQRWRKLDPNYVERMQAEREKRVNQIRIGDIRMLVNRVDRKFTQHERNITGRILGAKGKNKLPIIRTFGALYPDVKVTSGDAKSAGSCRVRLLFYDDFVGGTTRKTSIGTLASVLATLQQQIDAGEGYTDGRTRYLRVYWMSLVNAALLAVLEDKFKQALKGIDRKTLFYGQYSLTAAGEAWVMEQGVPLAQEMLRVFQATAEGFGLEAADDAAVGTPE